MAAKDPVAALAEITSYFNKRDQALAAISERDATVFLTQGCALIDRHAPPGSAYRAAKDKAVSRPVVGAGDVRWAALHLEEVDSILKALQEDYANGRIELPPDVGIAAYSNGSRAGEQ